MAVTMVCIALMGVLAILRHRLRGSSPARQAMHAFVRRVGGTEARTKPGQWRPHPLVDHPKNERHYVVRVDEIMIEIFPWLGEGQKTNLELNADLAVPPGSVFKVSKGGTEPPPAEIAAEWRAVTSRVGWLILRCDGDTVTAQLGYPFDVDGVAAVADLVARVARLDGGLGAALLALPEATALTGHALVPGVVLGVDGLVIGVRGRTQVVAQLDDVTHVGQLPGPTQDLVARAGDGELLVTEHGARFTWKGIERDPAKLRAGVDALRSLRAATGPYR